MRKSFDGARMPKSRMNPNPPAKPWIVLTMKRVGAEWHITLENHYYARTDPNFRASWGVDLKDERFDVSRARVIE